MDRALLQERLYEYIEQATDRKLHGLYMLIEDDLRERPTFVLSKEELSILDEEREKHIKGISPSYNLSEAQAIIRGLRNL